MFGKRILLGITGGIAAYKIAFLIRLLKKSGAEVKCIMTPASSDFISPLVVSTLSENPVAIEFWNRETGEWNNHVELALWADLLIIAPLTANTLSKMVTGACDNFLLAVYLSAKCPVVVAPAMDLDMYRHPTTSHNLGRLEEFGVIIIPAEEGELASGLFGTGRMAEPETIYRIIEEQLGINNDFTDQKVLITAGPTREKIDPVRYISNHSSGKMGYAIAEELLKRGASVTLVSGPTELKLNHPKLKIVQIESAQEMLQAVQENWREANIGIFAAAVADYAVSEPSEIKIKKKDENLKLELSRNPDILKWAGEHKNQNQLLVGFALETNDALANAKDKLERKNLDFIVINTLEDKNAGFAYDTNKISILDSRNNLLSFELKSKQDVAKDIVNSLIIKS